MGKSRIRESLIRGIVNVVVHEILARHTNRFESVHFLKSEIAEYRSQAEKITEEFNWNRQDGEYIEKKSLKMIKERLDRKYPDVKFPLKEAEKLVEEEIKDFGL